MSNTAIVTLCDSEYFSRAKRTIIDIRTRGQWNGDLVLVTIGFMPSHNFLDFYNITHKYFEHINTDYLIEQYNKNNPLKGFDDNRHYVKLTQWDKFHIFDNYFSKWNKIIYLDAGMRVFDRVSMLDEMNCDGKLIAPDDSPSYSSTKRFFNIIDVEANPEVTQKLFEEYSQDILNERHFLNCMWIYDTSLLKKCNKSDLIDAMYKYPICICNEMTIMNLLFTFKHKVWECLPEIGVDNKKTFVWNEAACNPDSTWRDYYLVKYPTTINFECD